MRLVPMVVLDVHVYLSTQLRLVSQILVNLQMEGQQLHSVKICYGTGVPRREGAEQLTVISSKGFCDLRWSNCSGNMHSTETP